MARLHPQTRRRPAAWLAALALAAVGCGEPADGNPPPARPAIGRAPLPSGLLGSERNTIEIYRRVAASVVFVANASAARGNLLYDTSGAARGSGSGFVWDDRGHVVTNYHVVHGGEHFAVSLSDGTTYEAELVGIAPRKDLAVLRIDADVPLRPVTLGDSNGLVVGQTVLAIGNPFGLDASLTQGVISALGREIESIAGTRIENVIQTDASINPGSSGGPLLDSQGRVIGVTTAIYSPSGASAGIGFAVPAATVARLVPQLIEYGHVKWAGLGVQVMPDPIAAQWGALGVIVRAVPDDSPAARAGLRSLRTDALGNVTGFDVITNVEGRPVFLLVDLIDVLDDYEPGDTVKVRFERDGRAHEVRVELAELP